MGAHDAPTLALQAAARRRALLLGCELDRLNRLRADRAARLFRVIGSWQPRHQPVALRSLARLDGQRRELRALLAEQLEDTDAR